MGGRYPLGYQLSIGLRTGVLGTWSALVTKLGRQGLGSQVKGRLEDVQQQ